MTEAAIKRWIDRHLPTIMSQLGLQEWFVRVSISTEEAPDIALEIHTAASVDYDAPHREAHMTVHVTFVTNAAKLRAFVTHELLHLVVADLETVASTVARGEVEGALVEDAVELLVCRLEKIVLS